MTIVNVALPAHRTTSTRASASCSGSSPRSSSRLPACCSSATGSPIVRAAARIPPRARRLRRDVVPAARRQTVGELIAARALMGVAAACVMPPALSLLAVLFSPELRPKAVGIWSGGRRGRAGPRTGRRRRARRRRRLALGLPSQCPLRAGGRSARAALAARVAPARVPPLDIPGVALSTLALTGTVFALIEGVDAGWTSPAVLAAAVAGLGAGAAFLTIELRRRRPAVRRARAGSPACGGGGAGILGATSRRSGCCSCSRSTCSTSRMDRPSRRGSR